MIGVASQPRRREGVLAQRVDQTTVLLDPRPGEYFSLDEVGSRIWDLCDGTRTPAAIAEVICEEYDAGPATVQADVLELLADLAGAGLLESA
jgi:hypothetical protein